MRLMFEMADEDGDDYITFDEYWRIMLSEPEDAIDIAGTAAPSA